MKNLKRSKILSLQASLTFRNSRISFTFNEKTGKYTVLKLEEEEKSLDYTCPGTVFIAS